MPDKPVPPSRTATEPVEAVRLLSSIRDEFPGTQKWIYLETSARGLLPRTGRDAAVRCLDAQMLEGGDKAAMFDAVERVRAKFAALVGVERDEVAIVKNVSEGLNAVIASFLWQTGDNAVICREIEHPNGIYALYNMRDRFGVDVRVVRPTSDKAMPIPTIAKAIDKLTRVVVASSATFTTGARTDLAALGRICRDRGVFLLVDGAQSVGALQLNASAEMVDGLTVGASKYLCGPYGMGFLYVRRELADGLRPSWLARYGVDLGNLHEGEQGGARFRLMPGARRFDLGSYNYVAANAVEATLDILLKIGVRNIENHVLGLARRFTDGLRELDIPLISGAVPAHLSHIVVVGATKPSAQTAADLNSLYTHLTENLVKLSIRHGRLRFAFHLYNTGEEVETVLGLVRDWTRRRGKTR